MKHNINNYKKKIIKIVSQDIQVDYKEPYKLDEAKSSIGSGFFIKNNYILTCSHCVVNSKDIYIETSTEGQKKYKVELVGICPRFDIALLKSVEYNSKDYFELGNSDKVSSGSEVYAVGFPLGQNNIKITKGIVSGRQYGNIQTDTPLNPGNSGGPLIHKNKVIGINKSIIVDSNNVGYTIPINKYNTIKKELYSKTLLINRISMKTLFLYNNTNDALLKLNKATHGVYISNILTLHNNNKANTTKTTQNNKTTKTTKILQEGDILTHINNKKIDNFGYIKATSNEKIVFTELLDYIKLNEMIYFKLIRNKKSINTNFKFQYNQLPIRKLYPRFERLDYEVIGGLVITTLSVNYLEKLNEEEELNVSLYNYFDKVNRIKPKIIVSYIYPNTIISNINVINEGDIIEEVNNIKVSTISELRTAVKKYTKIGNTKYIVIKTDTNKEIAINVKDYLDKENNMRNVFKYPKTELYTNIIK